MPPPVYAQPGPEHGSDVEECEVGLVAEFFQIQKSSAV